MPQTPQELKATIDASGAPDSVKAQTWEAFTSANDPTDFKKRLDKIMIPNEVKGKLWDMKANSLTKAMSDVTSTSFERGEPSVFDATLGRLGSTIGSVVKTVGSPPETTTEKVAAGLVGPGGPVAVRAGSGLLEAEKEAGKQVFGKEGFMRQSGEALAKGEYKDAAGNLLRGTTTFASMLDPFATGTVVDINNLVKSGRYNEATGTAVGDVLALLIGEGIGRGMKSRLGPLTPRRQTAKLTTASGATAGEMTRNLDRVLPELNETARVNGLPKTVADFYENVGKAERAINTKYGLAIQQVGNQQLVPNAIAKALIDKADSLPKGVADAAVEARELRQMALDYQKPRTVADLEKERTWRNALSDSYENQKLNKQISSSQKATSAQVNSLIADALRDVIYDDVLEKQFPGQGFRDLKLKQKSLIDIKSHLREQVPSLQTKQAALEGEGILGRFGMSASIHPGGMTPRLHGLSGKVFPRWFGPEVKANRMVERAFRGQKGAPTKTLAPLQSPPAQPKSPISPKPTPSGGSSPQGGHAGGTVSSVEELNRPGKHYVINRSNEVTAHGKSYSPEGTRPGSVHVTVKPNGEYQVNEGTLSAAQKAALDKVSKETNKPKLVDPKTGIPQLTAAQTKQYLGMVGKNVSVKGKPATVIGTAFGKITVKMQDGSIVRVEPDEIKAGLTPLK